MTIEICILHVRFFKFYGRYMSNVSHILTYNTVVGTELKFESIFKIFSTINGISNRNY